MKIWWLKTFASLVTGFLGSCAIVAFGVPKIAIAEQACPDWMLEETEIRTTTARPGFDPGTPFTYETRWFHQGRVFQSEIGYYHDWPHPEYLKETVIGSGVSDIGEVQRNRFAFWHETLRYPERNLVSVPYRRFCEAGREPPTEDDYIIYFRLISDQDRWNLRSDHLEGVVYDFVPRALFNKLWIESSSMVEHDWYEDTHYGLRRQYTENSGVLREQYWSENANAMQVFGWCIYDNLPSQRCQIDVQRLDKNFFYRAYIPNPLMPNWLAVLSDINTLLDRWETAAE